MIASPVGIDVKIQALQLDLSASIFAGKNYVSYGQAFKNERNDKPVPEVFIDGKDYREVLTDDRLDALSFFLVNGESGEGYTVGLYFFVNLQSIYGLGHRAVNEAQGEVMQRVIRSGFEAVRVVTGLAAVSEFDGVDTPLDMEPFYCFRIDLFSNVTFC